MQRIGFLLKVRSTKLDEYREIHRAVWPDLLGELKAAGINNYSLWLRPDGTEFGYLECEDWDAACAYLAGSEIHTRWQQFMADFLETPTDAGEGGQPVQRLEMSFFLE